MSLSLSKNKPAKKTIRKELPPAYLFWKLMAKTLKNNNGLLKTTQKTLKNQKKEP
jgi:hypothetical protein